jgi:hypothetical protein
MLFSVRFGVARGKDDDWFDTILDNDTPLFVDPFAIFKDLEPRWRRAHHALIRYFDQCFMLVAKSEGLEGSRNYERAVSLLTIPEPQEFCLGYTYMGTAGRGPRRARDIARGMWTAIERGLEDLRHFEELGILNHGIGPDGISDMTCTVLRDFFVDYTRDVARRLDLPTDVHSVPVPIVEGSTLDWEMRMEDLPTNPYGHRPVLLVPARFLRRSPVINAEDWWIWYAKVEELDREILSHVDKRRIVDVARANLHLVREWVKERAKGPPDPYDLDEDRSGVWRWDGATHAFVQAQPASLPQANDAESFYHLIDGVIDRYRHFLEDEGGWGLLWNDDHTEKAEHAAQLIFRGIAQYDCRANDIVLDPEVNLGRGPVDFAFSRGYKQRALLEVKKLHNGRFWDGLEKQLISYMRSGVCDDGWLLAIKYRDGGVSARRAADLPERVAKTASANNVRLRYGFVDGTPKLSASKLS